MRLRSGPPAAVTKRPRAARRARHDEREAGHLVEGELLDDERLLAIVAAERERPVVAPDHETSITPHGAEASLGCFP
jgi:hypothetical protein